MPGYKIGAWAVVEYIGFWLGRYCGVVLFLLCLLVDSAIGPKTNPGLEWVVLIEIIVSVVVMFRVWGWTSRSLQPRIRARIDAYEYQQRVQAWEQYERWRRSRGDTPGR